MRIGIDLGGTKIEGIVMDDTGGSVFTERRPTPAAQGYDAILTAICDLAFSLERQAGGPCRIGIGTPGALSRRSGGLKNSNTTCLNGRPVKEDIEARLQRPVRMSNDANCFTLSEAVDGAGRGYPLVFGVILGTGVGGGIAFHRRVHEGPQSIAGEWGHNVLEPDGPVCYCGKRGCVETFLSGPGLVRDFAAQGSANVAGDTTPGMEEVDRVGDHKDVGDSATQGAVAENQRSRTAAHGRDQDLDAQTIVNRATAGDPIAEAAMQRFLSRFGRALATVINILDPDAVVLGGGLSNIKRLYSEGRVHIARHVFNDELLTPILPNQWGDSSGVRGAAQLWRPGE